MKPPPPNVAQAAEMPGYAHSRLLPPPPNGEAPKPPSVAEGPKTPPKIEGPKTPPKADARKTPPKEGASARSAPEVPKAVTVAVEPAKEDEPAKKKAALSSSPAAVPVASSAAAFLEPVPKIAPPKAQPKEQGASTAEPTSTKLASSSKSLVPKMKSRPKGNDQPSEEQKPVSIKIETKQCERCFAETFKGQLECDVCGLMLEGAGKADRRKIAERRQAALHKLGLYYDYNRGEYLQSITQHQLESLGLHGDQARGSSSPEADLLKRAKSRYDRALSLGFISVAERFTQDATFAESVLNEVENEYDCQRYDLLRAAHLPKPDRTKAQVRLGVSEQSQLERNAMRLVFLDIPSRLDMPSSFKYIDQPWIYMYRTEVYSEEEYIEYLGRNPQHNLLLSCTGVDNVAVHDAERHLKWIKAQNEISTRRTSRRSASSLNVQRSRTRPRERPGILALTDKGPQRKAPLTRLPEHLPKLKQRHHPRRRVCGSKLSAQRYSPRQDRQYTGERQKWHGRWYQKLIRHGRIEWEQEQG